MKIAVIGGGSSYTPELISGFLSRVDSLPLTELWLMDIASERLKTVGGLAQRMVKAQNGPFTVHLTTDRREAVKDATYVITQVRVGGMEARREDEYLGRRHGLIGQETTGVGGMAMALRTIPVLLELAREMKSLAPDALLVNFSNPAGLVTEALYRHAPGIPTVGVCNVPITAKMAILAGLKERTGEEIEPGRTRLRTLGLNHLSWHRGFYVDGHDRWEDVFAAFLEHVQSESDPEWDLRTLQVLGMIPNYYLQYYYYTNRKFAAQASWPPSRAEEVIRIEESLLNQYAEPDRLAPPDDLMQRGGAYYSTVATQLLNAHYNDLGEVHVVNTRHGGAIEGWPKDWVLEIPCHVDAKGIHPIPDKPLPAVCFGLIAHVKSYEQLTADAAVSGDKDLAYAALLAHPLGPPADRVQEVLEDLLKTHRDYLPQFQPS